MLDPMAISKNSAFCDWSFGLWRNTSVAVSVESPVGTLDIMEWQDRLNF